MDHLTRAALLAHLEQFGQGEFTRYPESFKLIVDLARAYVTSQPIARSFYLDHIKSLEDGYSWTKVMAAMPDGPRILGEIDLAMYYTSKEKPHGTSGHLANMTISALTRLVHHLTGENYKGERDAVSVESQTLA